MIATLWQSYALECGVLWAVLAGIWLWAQPQNSRWLDRVYPLAPLAVFGIFWVFPQANDSLSKFLQLGIWLWVWLSVVWVISMLKRDASIMDIAYGFVLLCGTWWLFFSADQKFNDVNQLLLAMVSLGFGRYAVYILWRNLPHGEDPRYAKWRQRSGSRFWWWSYFQIFLLQGVVVWVWMVPLFLGLQTSGPIQYWHIAGACVWLIGFVFEAGGDWQLTQFKRHRQDNTQLLNTGLWALTRHPNYFGQTCMWWGYGVFALAHPWGWLSVFSVAYITWFMNKGSATSLMERHMIKTKPGYAEYCATVPSFFPRLWKKQQPSGEST